MSLNANEIDESDGNKQKKILSKSYCLKNRQNDIIYLSK